MTALKDPVTWLYPELDARAEKWMQKWRFHPNTVTEVQLPTYYYYSRR